MKKNKIIIIACVFMISVSCIACGIKEESYTNAGLSNDSTKIEEVGNDGKEEGKNEIQNTDTSSETTDDSIDEKKISSKSNLGKKILEGRKNSNITNGGMLYQDDEITCFAKKEMIGQNRNTSLCIIDNKPNKEKELTDVSPMYINKMQEEIFTVIKMKVHRL